MTTDSYPAKGVGGFTVAEWAKLHDNPDGIVNDYTGTAFSLTRNSATNVATVAPSPAPVVTSGYGLEVTGAGEDLAVPTAAGTYYIAAMYDPNLNVAEPGQIADPLGPCRLVIDTSLSTAGGKQYTLLYSITRAAGQALTAATVADYRRWVGPVVTVQDYLSATPTGFGPWSRGTIMLETATGGSPNLVNISVRTLNAAGTALVWQNWLSPAAVPLPTSSLLVAQASPAQMFRVNGASVGLQGTLRRSNGTSLGTGSTVVLGNLPVGWRPKSNRGPYVVGSFGNVQGIGRVYVDTSGEVTLAAGVGQEAVKWVSLDGIEFRTGA